jgi:hypothetical protein
MAMTAADRQKMAQLEGFGGRVQHVHGLVERFAVDLAEAERWTAMLRRSLTQLKMELMGAGFDSMAQQCGALEMAARRGSSRVAKIRILREGIGSLRQQIELEQRTVRSEAENRKTDDGGGGGDGATPPPPEAS